VRVTASSACGEIDDDSRKRRIVAVHREEMASIR
jgi:hypothetical protein